MTGEEKKLPPHNVEAEEAVLGSLILDADAMDVVGQFLKPELSLREHTACQS